MAYKVIILYQLYMPSYFLGTFTEYPYGKRLQQRALFRIFTGFPHISYRKYEIHQNRCEDIIFYNEFLEK